MIIQSKSTNPYFNIASEEHLLKNFTDDIFMLYRNEPSVIVGKHQNALAELDLKFVDEQGITVVRRLSGGGAVYHDLGNLNFTFIRNGVEGKLVDFRGFTQPIVDALANLGVNAKFEGHNSIMVNGQKISGNAEHIYRKRVMHHGTLLFSSNLDTLAKVLYVDENKFSHRAVKSVRADVVNLSNYLPQSMTINRFEEFLMQYVRQTSSLVNDYSFTESDVNSINQLIKSKYSTWEWNFGYSPSYSLERKIETSMHGEISLLLKVERGVIEKIELTGDSLTPVQREIISNFFLGKPHHRCNTRNQIPPLEVERELLDEIRIAILP